MEFHWTLSQFAHKDLKPAVELYSGRNFEYCLFSSPQYQILLLTVNLQAFNEASKEISACGNRIFQHRCAHQKDVLYCCLNPILSAQKRMLSQTVQMANSCIRCSLSSYRVL